MTSRSGSHLIIKKRIFFNRDDAILFGYDPYSRLADVCAVLTSVLTTVLTTVLTSVLTRC